MSDDLKEKLAIVESYFKGFSNHIELENFRSFLLFTLTSQVPTNIMSQLGMGGSKDVIILPYNPYYKIYYQKINLFSTGSLIVYLKADPLSEDFILEKDNPIFKEYLNSNEMDLAFRGKEKILLPKISDVTSIDNSDVIIKVDDLHHSLESFMAIAEPNILFVLDAKNGSDPDLLFAFNMMPEMPSLKNKDILKIDVFLDYDHKTKEMTYLKREEDFKLVYMKDIKEISHADLYKSAFSFILHIKSLDKPF